jgi:hypothetical protein
MFVPLEVCACQRRTTPHALSHAGSCRGHPHQVAANLIVDVTETEGRSFVSILLLLLERLEALTSGGLRLREYFAHEPLAFVQTPLTSADLEQIFRD